MKLPLLTSIFKNREKTEHPNSWQWPPCTHPKTLSFRADGVAGAGDAIFKTVNSVYLDHGGGLETPESWFTSTSDSASFSTESDDERIIVTGVRSDRLFFDRGDTTSSSIAKLPENQENLEIQETERGEDEIEEMAAPFEESVIMAIESEDPYADFKKSMEEIVESHGIKEDWEALQELLGWYLKMNGRLNHGFIIGAFVDLLIELTTTSPNFSKICGDDDKYRINNCCSSSNNVVSTSYSSAVSCLSSPPTSPLSSLDLKEVEEQG